MSTTTRKVVFTMKKDFRVYLRPLKEGDGDVSIHWRRNDEIWKTMIGPRYFVSHAYEKQWVTATAAGREDQRVLAICRKDTHDLIGFVYLTQIDRQHRTAFSGKLIGMPEAWSMGYGPEATLLMLYQAFMEMGLERIESRQMVWHHAARRSVEKLGYQKEGILRRAVFKDGVFHDMSVLSLLKSEFLPWLDVYRFPGETHKRSREEEST